MRKILTLFYLVLFPFALFAQTHHIWVGERYHCSIEGAVMGLTSDVNWSSSAPVFNMTGSGFYRDVVASRYFNGSATVTCTWKYRFTSRDTWKTQKKSWTFVCRDNKASVSPTSMTLAVGQSDYLFCSHQYDNQYSGAANVTYSSSNSSIARVSGNGEVTGVSPGTTYITVYSDISSELPTCRVTVEKIDPVSISIPSSQTVYVGEEVSMTHTLSPSNAQTTVTWTSRDENVARFSSGNSLRGISEGTARVYARTSNGLMSNDCNVTVRFRTPTGVSVNKSSAYIPIGQTMTLSAVVQPSNAKYTLPWSSDNTDVAEVSSSGVVTAFK